LTSHAWLARALGSEVCVLSSWRSAAGLPQGCRRKLG
jgi:hypothetical protein